MSVDASIPSTTSWSGSRRLFMHPSTLTILATYRCTAACEHCCFDSNPGITQRLGLDEILDFIRQAAQYPELSLVVFSGGECFLLGKDLVSAIQFCKSLGLHTRCVTNGYWAKSLSSGRRRLRELADAGLGELNISTGDFHQRFVDEETVINAACLSVELELDNTLIMIEVQKERRITRDSLLANPRIHHLVTNYPCERFKIIESPWMPMTLDKSIPQEEVHLLNSRNLHLRGGCPSMFSTIVLTPSRKVGFCCGLTRERIPELNALWDGQGLDPILVDGGEDFMKIWLAVDGPERILAWAASKDPEIEWENRYAHHCHACLALFADERVRNAIRSYYRERVDDVLIRYCMMLRLEQSVDFRQFRIQQPNDP